MFLYRLDALTAGVVATLTEAQATGISREIIEPSPLFDGPKPLRIPLTTHLSRPGNQRNILRLVQCRK